MVWTRRNWLNKPNTSTPFNAAAMNNIEDGVEEAVTATRGRLSDANLASTFVAVRTSDGHPLAPGTIVVITLDKTLAEITTTPAADIADITFEEA